MIVCHCHAVSDRDVAAAIDDGACDLGGIGRSCRAGTDCGACHPSILDVLDRQEVRVALPAAS